MNSDSFKVIVILNVKYKKKSVSEFMMPSKVYPFHISQKFTYNHLDVIHSLHNIYIQK